MQLHTATTAPRRGRQASSSSPLVWYSVVLGNMMTMGNMVCVVECGGVWCGVVWCGVVWCAVMWCSRHLSTEP